MDVLPEETDNVQSRERWTPHPSWRQDDARNITFMVTEDCQLRCRYCYVVGKNSRARMPFDIARRSIDLILADPHISESPAVVWDFVGGEPFMEIELIDQICDYAKLRMYTLRHHWFDSYRFSFSTNGLLYSDQRVQRFIEKNKMHLSIGISIDGAREKHDAQRIYPDGSGSYEDVVSNIPLWLEQFPDAGTKVTIAHDDLPYLAESILHLWDLGIKQINANVVFEDVWQEGDDSLFESQLRTLADAIIGRNISPDYTCSLLKPNIGHPLDPVNDNQNWCGSGRMMAIDAAGNFYPCNRFAAASLQNREPVIIGNCFEGINENRLRPFLALTRKAQSTPECFDCDVASGCAWCQGDNYDNADTDTIYQRSTAICSMHKARARAASYFWDRVRKSEAPTIASTLIGSKALPEWSLPGLTHLVVLLDNGATAFCQESPLDTKRTPEWMPAETLARISAYTADKRLALSVMYGSVPTQEYDELLASVSHMKITPFMHHVTYPDAILVIESADLPQAVAGMHENGKQAIIRIAREHLPVLAEHLAGASQCFHRINTVMLDIERYTDDDLQCYAEQMTKLVEMLWPKYLSDEAGEISCLTDRPALSTMRNCGAGITHLTMAPDGRLYICPAFYRRNADDSIGSFEKGAVITNRQLLNYEHAPVCERCDAFHCPRCVYLNKQLTGEVNTPSRQQCELAHIERTASAELLMRLQGDERFQHYRPIPALDYRDPFELIRRELHRR